MKDRSRAELQSYLFMSPLKKLNFLLLTELDGWLVWSIRTPLCSGGEVIEYVEGLGPDLITVKFIRGTSRKIDFFFVIA